MPDLDDRLRDGLSRLAPGVDPTGVLERVESKKARVRLARRVQAASFSALTLAVAAAGIFLLIHAFRGTRPGPATATPPGKVAFVRFSPSAGLRADIFLTDGAGRSVTRLTDTEVSGEWANDPAWSPGGTEIAYVAAFSRSSRVTAGNIWVVKVDGTGARELTSDRRDGSPHWSPDGSRIVFVRDGSRLMVMDADGSGVREIHHSSCVQSPSWSPDGTRIAFIPCPGPSSFGIWTIGPDGAGLARLTSADASTPAWSPDGSQIAFSHWTGSRAGTREIYVMNADGTGIRRVTTCEKPGCSVDLMPTWSSDGSRIAFTRDVGGGNLRIYSVLADGSDLEQLTAGPADQSPAWQPVPAPAQSPSPRNLASVCDSSRVESDFDGDGGGDVALIFYPKVNDSCDVPLSERRYRLSVDWASGAGGEWPLPGCDAGFCRALAAVDPVHSNMTTFDLVVETGRGASTSILEFYELLPDGRPKEPLMAEGASGGGPQPLELVWGASVQHQDAIQCGRASDGTPEIVAVSSELDGAATHWLVTRTPFLFGGPVLRRGPVTHETLGVNDPAARSLEPGSSICGVQVGGATPAQSIEISTP